MKKLVALLAVLAMVNVASAAYVGGGVMTGDSFDFGGVTYNQWIVSLSVDNGGLAAIDGQFSGPEGSLLQQTKFTRASGTPTPWTFNTTAYGVNDATGALVYGLTPDTSLVFQDASYLLPVSFTENSNAVVPSTSGTVKTKFVYGAGSFFKLVTAFKPVAQGGIDTISGFEFAQLWVADGAEGDVNFAGLYSAMNDNGVKSNMNFPLVPEPATMGLLAIGALGLLRRKHA